MSTRLDFGSVNFASVYRCRPPGGRQREIEERVNKYEQQESTLTDCLEERFSEATHCYHCHSNHHHPRQPFLWKLLLSSSCFSRLLPPLQQLPQLTCCCGSAQVNTITATGPHKCAVPGTGSVGAEELAAICDWLALTFLLSKEDRLLSFPMLLPLPPRQLPPKCSIPSNGTSFPLPFFYNPHMSLNIAGTAHWPRKSRSFIVCTVMQTFPRTLFTLATFVASRRCGKVVVMWCGGESFCFPFYSVFLCRRSNGGGCGFSCPALQQQPGHTHLMHSHRTHESLCVCVFVWKH